MTETQIWCLPSPAGGCGSLNKVTMVTSRTSYCAAQAVCRVGSTMDDGARQHFCPREESCPYIPHPEARRFSSSLYVLGTLLFFCWSLGLAFMNVCSGSLRESLSLLSGLRSYPNGIPDDFSQPEIVGTPLPGSDALSWEAQCGVKIPWSLVRDPHT